MKKKKDKLIYRGCELVINKNKIFLYDKKCTKTDEEVIKIVEYLYQEGFVNSSSITVDIICGKDSSEN